MTWAAPSLDGMFSAHLFAAISLYARRQISREETTLASLLLRGEPLSLIPVCTLPCSRSPHAPKDPPLSDELHKSLYPRIGNCPSM